MLVAHLKIEKLHEDFGARITGVDLGAPLAADVLSAIRSAIDEFSFLHFPDQQFDDERHLAFTKQLGEPEENHLALGEDGRLLISAQLGMCNQMAQS